MLQGYRSFYILAAGRIELANGKKKYFLCGSQNRSLKTYYQSELFDDERFYRIFRDGLFRANLLDDQLRQRIYYFPEKRDGTYYDAVGKPRKNGRKERVFHYGKGKRAVTDREDQANTNYIPWSDYRLENELKSYRAWIEKEHPTKKAADEEWENRKKKLIGSQKQVIDMTIKAFKGAKLLEVIGVGP